MIKELNDLRQSRAPVGDDDVNVDERIVEAKRIVVLTPATALIAVLIGLGAVLLVQLGDSAQRQLATLRSNAAKMAKAPPVGLSTTVKADAGSTSATKNSKGGHTDRDRPSGAKLTSLQTRMGTLFQSGDSASRLPD
jgi:hypothetical protein